MKTQKRLSTTQLVTIFLLFLVMGGLLSTPVIAAPEQPAEKQTVLDAGEKPTGKTPDIIIYDGNKVDPWQMYIGSRTNWKVPVDGAETTSYKGKAVTVRATDSETGDHAYQAEWKGGQGQVYWEESKPWDFTDLAAQDGALSMVIRIDKQPRKKVMLKMDCGFPCAGTLNMTKLFKAIPKDQWFRISFKLSCFRKTGAILSKIVAPLVVATRDSFAMSFADVRFVTDPPPESVIACDS